MSSLPAHLLEFVRWVENHPSEVFSRFLLDRPRFLRPHEIADHVRSGWGLACNERAWAVHDYLLKNGFESEIIMCGFELWQNGQNVYRVHVSSPPNEDHIRKFYVPGWDTSIYERPVHFSHPAVLFKHEGKRFIIDNVALYRRASILTEDAVSHLLDREPRGYIDFGPEHLRMYFHRISPELYALVKAKEEQCFKYEIGWLLTAFLLVGTHSSVVIKWFWNERRIQLALDTLEAHRAAGKDVATYACQTLQEVREIATDITDEYIWTGFERALPNILACMNQAFDSPPHHRFFVGRSRKPLCEYISEEVILPSPSL